MEALVQEKNFQVVTLRIVALVCHRGHESPTQGAQRSIYFKPARRQ